MAAPDSANILNMTGNGTLLYPNPPFDFISEDLISQQGIPWIVRQIIKFASVELAMAHTSSPSPLSIETEGKKESELLNGKKEVSSIHVKQTVSPGGFNSAEAYILDWETREATVPLFGRIAVRSRYIPFSEIEDQTLREKLEASGEEKVAIEEIVKSIEESGWETHVIWGFEEIEGQRYYTRNSVTEKEGEKLCSRVVYDYLRDNET